MVGRKKSEALKTVYSARKRVLAFVLAAAMILTNVGVDMNTAFAASSSESKNEGTTKEETEVPVKEETPKETEAPAIEEATTSADSENIAPSTDETTTEAESTTEAAKPVGGGGNVSKTVSSDLVDMGYCSTGKAYTTTINQLKASDEIDRYTISYVWTDEPTGEYAQKLPLDKKEYATGEHYELDQTFKKGTAMEHLDTYGNVDGRWTFSGWTDPNHGVMGTENVTVTGSWTYAKVNASTYSVIYNWTNEPTGDYAQKLPLDEKVYISGQPYDVDKIFTSQTKVEHLDAYGNVDGWWTFSGWTDPNHGIMGTENVIVTGSWKWVGPLFTVTYSPGAHGAFVEQTTSGLNYGDSTPAFNGQATANGSYSFSGWDKDIKKTVTENVTYTAQWVYTGGTTPPDGSGSGGSGSSGSGGSGSHSGSGGIPGTKSRRDIETTSGPGVAATITFEDVLEEPLLLMMAVVVLLAPTRNATLIQPVVR